jgi:hypothetical protein
MNSSTSVARWLLLRQRCCRSVQDRIDPLDLGWQPHLDLFQEGHPAGRAARQVRPGERLAGSGAEGADDVALAAPAVVDLLPGSPGVVPCLDDRLASVGLGALRPHLVQADDYAARRRRRVEGLDPPLFSANAGSTRSPNPG